MALARSGYAAHASTCSATMAPRSNNAKRALVPPMSATSFAAGARRAIEAGRFRFETAKIVQPATGTQPCDCFFSAAQMSRARCSDPAPTCKRYTVLDWLLPAS